MVKVKICGITNIEDALAAAGLGADALGFVFYKGSPRYIAPDEAKKIISRLPPFISAVGVFVDEKTDDVLMMAGHAGIDIVQFHGHEPPEACIIDRRVIKAVRVKELSDLEPLKRYGGVSAFLLDTYAPDALGGTGRIFNWDIALEAKLMGRVILAGGLTPENVQQAVRWVHPYAVDVSSGVEKEKGKKDHINMGLFIARAKSA
ncbi:MAG: phosphoribosylanthranilate isomerase [Thermodesulfovibrionales bacterium]|nr:phosphoribosylanthranilate isomerase [Thermodesulfovibrionales bacterium]